MKYFKHLRGIMFGLLLIVGTMFISNEKSTKAAEVIPNSIENSENTEDEIGFGTITLDNSSALSARSNNSNYPDGNANVVGDGVRLRKNPSTTATILELMYNNEAVLINYTLSGKKSPNKTWFYVKRLKTGTWGWVKASYIYEWD